MKLHYRNRCPMYRTSRAIESLPSARHTSRLILLCLNKCLRSSKNPFPPAGTTGATVSSGSASARATPVAVRSLHTWGSHISLGTLTAGLAYLTLFTHISPLSHPALEPTLARSTREALVTGGADWASLSPRTLVSWRPRRTGRTNVTLITIGTTGSPASLGTWWASLSYLDNHRVREWLLVVIKDLLQLFVDRHLLGHLGFELVHHLWVFIHGRAILGLADVWVVHFVGKILALHVSDMLHVGQSSGGQISDILVGHVLGLPLIIILR
mmetsp:Transcript_8395/g.13254  ORF Transcript_8395/g.13254 Transcript_8395/m.13254 type:complete len:269 (-) Transcript_8395:222-1028(-)